MSIFDFLILLLIAAICGTIGQSIVGHSLGGWFISAGVGLIGPLIGTWLAAELGFSYLLPLDVDGETNSIIWTTAGASPFAVVVGSSTGRTSRPAVLRPLPVPPAEGTALAKELLLETKKRPAVRAAGHGVTLGMVNRQATSAPNALSIGVSARWLV